ncbi:MAG: hypothetical protein ACXADY_26425 [Candidatus Hodarchaeales archaeon]|jgi:hypothetical protein
MGDVNDGQGQNTGSPDANPDVPSTTPADAGQDGAGQDAGQGGTPAGHQLDPNLTKAQQEAAEARREVEALRRQIDEFQQSQPAPAVDEERAASQKAFDDYAGSSSVVQAAQANALNIQAQNIDTQLAVRKEEFPQYRQVRDKVMRDVAQLGAVPASKMDEVINTLYHKHTGPLNTTALQAARSETEALRAKVDAYEAAMGKQNIDVGTLQAAGGTAPTVSEPGPNATPAELAAFIDSHRRPE